MHFTPSLRSTNDLNVSLHIVYFANLYEQKWQRIVRLQLDELKQWGLAAFAKSITVVFTYDSSSLEAQRKFLRRFHIKLPAIADPSKDAIALVREIVPQAVVEIHRGNEYEYRGIRAMWNKAQAIPARDAHRHVVL